MSNKVKSTAKQSKQIAGYRNGCGFMIYKQSDSTTIEFEFFIKEGAPHYMVSGTKVNLEFYPEQRDIKE